MADPEMLVEAGNRIPADGRLLESAGLQVQEAALTGESPLARLHALWTLEGMGRLEDRVPVKALSDPDPRVRLAGLRA